MSNKVLEHAIEVRTKVKKLTAAVSSARIKHQQDAEQVRGARDRLQSVYEDLEAAIKKLAIINEDSQKSLAESLGAVETLKEYRNLEADRTRKARKNKS